MKPAVGPAGVTSIGQQSPEYVKEAKLVVAPHEMGAFRLLIGPSDPLSTPYGLAQGKYFTTDKNKYAPE